MEHVKTSVLKARLSAYLRRVRRGERIEVLDRTTPVARLVPVESSGEGFRVEEPVGKPCDLLDLPRIKPAVGIDAAQLLQEDRSQR